MRLFIAFEIIKPYIAELERIAEHVRSLHPGGRAVPQDNLHVTIYFAGECNCQQAEVLRRATIAAFHESTLDQPPIFPAMLSVTKPGFFRTGNSGTLWLAVEADPVLRFYALLMKSLAHFGLKDGAKRTLVPHITIARNLPAAVCRQLAGGVNLMPLSDLARQTHFIVAGPTLMESCQGKGRMLYRARCRPAIDEGWIEETDL